MSRLSDELAAVLPAGMRVPDELARLYDWIEARGLVHGDRSEPATGVLARAEPDTGSLDVFGGTYIEFRAGGDHGLAFWFGGDDPAVHERLCVFARTGGDGSMAALWLDDDGRQRIVHMGSGSGSTLVCVLADEAIDFLRLLAVGYAEICWADEYDDPPNTDRDEDEPFVHPNVAYREWLGDEFAVTIPERGADVVSAPAFMDDETSDDPFWLWTRRYTR